MQPERHYWRLGQNDEGVEEHSRVVRFIPGKGILSYEIVPPRLQPGGAPYSPTRLEPTATVKQFGELGIEYFYYDPTTNLRSRMTPSILRSWRWDIRILHGDSRPF